MARNDIVAVHSMGPLRWSLLLLQCMQDAATAAQGDDIDWVPMPRAPGATGDSGLRCILIFTAAIVSAHNWPAGGMEVIKTFLVALILDYMIAAGGALAGLARMVQTVHATADASSGRPGARHIRLSIGFKYGAALLSELPYILTTFPLYLKHKPTFAALAAGAAPGPMCVRVSLSIAPNMWLGKCVQDMYAAIRISGVNFLLEKVVQHILETYNNKKHVYGKLLDIKPDRSQATAYATTALPGNDYIAIVTDCRFTDPIILQVPIRTILQHSCGPVAEALPPFKTIVLTRQSAVPLAHWRKGGKAASAEESVHQSKRSRLEPQQQAAAAAAGVAAGVQRMNVERGSAA